MNTLQLIICIYLFIGAILALISFDVNNDKRYRISIGIVFLWLPAIVIDKYLVNKNKND